MLEEKIDIKNIIYEIRGKQVILDSDLAKLYQCKNGTKDINKAVKRNIERFPEGFYFQLNKDEYYILRFQNGTLDVKPGKYSKYLPYVFTEQGIAMLSSVLRTNIATKVSINIMRAFVEMRKYISTNLIEQKYINDLVIKDSKRIDLLEEAFNGFKETSNNIFFKGQIYDVYSKILDIFKLAKKELIIVDPYADKMVLDIIHNLNVKVILICKKNNKLTNTDVDKYNLEYNNLFVIRNDSFHDRYFIIDNNKIYHSGTSINNAGNKTFSINILVDEFVKQSLLKEVNKLCKTL